MSAASEDTMTPDQVTVKSLRELTASIQNLCDTITSDYHNNHPDNSRGRPKIKDTISATLHEEMTKGPPQQIMDWEKIEPMATDEIEMKNKLYTQKYEDDIYRLIGWRDKDSEGKRDYTEPTYFELSLTYALLFRPISSSNLRRLENYVNAGKYLQLPWNKCVTFGSDPIHRLLRRDKEEAGLNFKKLDIDPVQSPTKDILSESFYRCSVPPSIQVAFNLANPSETVKGITDQCDQHKVTKTSMHQISELAPNYPEDLKFMIISVMESNFADVESFTRASQGQFASYGMIAGTIGRVPFVKLASLS
ncbi:hypothetical protein ZTR_09393 [Talaromyces verruculosus]|nr:hypothetical protein ZTR_09393 [Talaromyces verruculosus]